MRLYAESSAVLAWLLGEPTGAQARATLEAADLVIASDLTLIECDRVLIRLAAFKHVSEAEIADRRARLLEASTHWDVLRLSPEIVDRARRPFPVEPVRTLDALHLASALVAKASVSGLEMLSLDDRVRGAARALGIPLQPN
jgi:predicted nucleic acid-binding protein